MVNPPLRPHPRAAPGVLRAKGQRIYNRRRNSRGAGGDRVKIGVPREVADGERRVGLVPETVGRLVRDGFEVLIETGAGRDYNLDENYEEAGATIVEDAGEAYGEADIVVKVAKPTEDEVGQMREGQFLACFLNGPQDPGLVKALADAG